MLISEERILFLVTFQCRQIKVFAHFRPEKLNPPCIRKSASTPQTLPNRARSTPHVSVCLKATKNSWKVYHH